MVAGSPLTVFLSYSHDDRHVARRIVRRFTAHGIKVWIDERELRVGTNLTSSLRTQIKSASVILVVASEASAVSDWVGKELMFAREQGKSIVPVFIDTVDKHERFSDYKGIYATSPQAFSKSVHDLMRDMFLSLDLELPIANPSILESGLRDLAREEPDLDPLITGCLDHEGLNLENSDTVYYTSFHPLDYALNALFELMPNRQVATTAAYGFRFAGAGTKALFSWIAASGHGGVQLVHALGVRLKPELIETAISLLGACEQPNDQALFEFINHNESQLDQEQCRSVIRLITWPVRNDSKLHARMLGFIVLKLFSDSDEVQRMWDRWIYSGAFDGVYEANYIADCLVFAHEEQLPVSKRLNEKFRQHVRSYLRSGDVRKIMLAVEYVRACADAGAIVIYSLTDEMTLATSSAEWKSWEGDDPDNAVEMSQYVFAHYEEAVGDRDWGRAKERSDPEACRPITEAFRKLLSKNKKRTQ